MNMKVMAVVNLNPVIDPEGFKALKGFQDQVRISLAVEQSFTPKSAVQYFDSGTAADMAAMLSSCAALRPSGVRVSAPRQSRSRVVVAVAKAEVSLRAKSSILMPRSL